MKRSYHFIAEYRGITPGTRMTMDIEKMDERERDKLSHALRCNCVRTTGDGDMIEAPYIAVEEGEKQERAKKQ